jgi:hypothetical protein
VGLINRGQNKVQCLNCVNMLMNLRFTQCDRNLFSN